MGKPSPVRKAKTVDLYSVVRHEHADVPYAVGLLRTRHERPAIAGSLIGHRRQTGLQPRRLGEVDAESVALALVAAGHLGTGVAQLLLHVAFIDLRGGGETGPQRMPGEFLPPFGLPKDRPGCRCRSAGRDQPPCRRP
jgi:hypothetical protein